jgi:hypothetical protein
MRPGKAAVLERERRWAAPVSAATIVGVLMIIAGLVAVQTAIGSGTNYEGLEAVDDKTASVIAAGALNAIGFALLAAPLLYLFRAAQGRSERVRGELIGLVVIAPIFLAISGGLLTAGTHQAATRFVDGTAKPTLSAGEAGNECRAESKDKGAKAFGEEFEATKGTTSFEACQTQKVEEDRASNAIDGTSLVEVAQYIGLAGSLALVVSLFYSCLWAMRTGLLTRFWGSLGMALGIATLLGLTPFTLIWFFFFGLLVAGWVPGGRPPAWAAGEAIPWPTPGQEAASRLEGGAGEADLDDGPGDGPGERRKRKQRT